MAKQFDVLVIGGGPGGYVAAIRAAQLGLNVACVESQSYADPKGEVRLGGTCLNVGCIPSKALLQSSEYFDQANHSFVMHGISFDNVKMDVTTMLRRKDNIVTQLTGGIRSLFKKNKVTLLVGHGRFAPSPRRIPTSSSNMAFEGRGFPADNGRENEPWQIEISATNGSETVEARHVIIATGSKPRHLPGVPVDNKMICDNVGALCLESVPKRLGVIGAGVIGLELGSVWKRLGAEVTILEALPDFLAAADQAVANEAWKIFTRKQGLDIHLGIKLGKISVGKKMISIDYETGDETATLECDKLIVSVGRLPNTDGLGCEGVGLKLDERGRVAVDEHCHTNLENVWAVGDVVPGPMLAHKGMEEGIMVAELIAGQAGHVDYNTVPWVIYTHPEIAWVGRTEQQLKSDGVAYRVGQIPFLANGRALGQGDTLGFVKMLADAQ
ncbi:MAG: dihydrolipoyl dehydrogenase, partial [Proteobacteria bacterium]|nr:dihydrolipoyl dehydrogenase [Pseudomonadota bacterium]